jgi:chaperonin GroES
MNKSGIEPMEYKVLIAPKKVEEKTQGGIILVEETKNKERFATQEGVLIAVGAIAFTEPDWLNVPKVGDTVMFDRYAGGLIEGKDGEDYRLLNDKEICARIHERKEVSEDLTEYQERIDAFVKAMPFEQGPRTVCKLAATNEPYVTVSVGDGKAYTAKEACEEYEAALNTYAIARKGTVYWRTAPVMERFGDDVVVFSRLLISEKEIVPIDDRLHEVEK